MVEATAFEPEMAQVKVTFTTTEDGFQLPETKRQLLVPAGMALPTPQAMQTRRRLADEELEMYRYKTSRPLPRPQLRVHAGYPPTCPL